MPLPVTTTPGDDGMITMKVDGLDALQARLKKITDDMAADKMPYLRVGVLEKATDEKGNPIAPRAFFNEFGTAHIPPRPAFRETVQEKADQWANGFAQTIKNEDESSVLTAEAMNKAFRELGVVMVADLQAKIGSGVGPPLAESTVARKAKLLETKKYQKKVPKKLRGNPELQLVETGEYLKSIDMELTTGGAK